MDTTSPPTEHLDAVVVGAGISGISAAHHLRTDRPGSSVAILEARSDLGGTWDLFRFPGIRSDTDMFTLGFPWKPWDGDRSIADGSDIHDYLRRAVRSDGLEEVLRLNTAVRRASWSSQEARWELEVVDTTSGAARRITCRFLVCGAGYYRYEPGHTPEIPGLEDFDGEVVHPQHWPEALDHAGRRLVVIGSGATAVTIVPALAETAAKVTMLQRSPTYTLTLPRRDPVDFAARRLLSLGRAQRFSRRKNAALLNTVYRVSKRAPGLVRRLLRLQTKRQLPSGYPVDTHFRPRYDPWEERLCVVPDGDLFEAISGGTAEVVTGRIDTVTPTGIRLESGQELEADVIVTATGMDLEMAGDIDMDVDGEPVRWNDRLAYKGVMASGVPNFVYVVGYVHASWTLRADLVCRFAVRLLDEMDRRGASVATPTPPASEHATAGFLELDSGYVRRGIHRFPQQGERDPWRVYQDYPSDERILIDGRLDDDMTFAAPGAAPRIEAAATAAG